MYVRRKSNRFKSTRILVVEKRNEKICYLKTIGVSSDENDIQKFILKGMQWICNQLGQEYVLILLYKIKTKNDVS